ncbi:Kinesin light chain [Seminavis robusta]|uniref:Kinesin light chain n=1 Tax=Seminavis robusta TaxID=568900 RepID=A0A9N8HYX6_9STRA|nr:Kinesin light chain [Seminavis robusta]|eukprot:Sro3067_g343110.1 Kinesin light chain (628) ;mRNA; r:2852-4735
MSSGNTQPLRKPSYDGDDISARKKKCLDTLGVSVHHLAHFFMKKEVCAARTTRRKPFAGLVLGKDAATTGTPLSRDSKIYQIENLQRPPGVIRMQSADTICPIDGRKGSAYVHSLKGKDHVGEATHMLSYSWDYTIGDIVDTLSDFCLQKKLNPKRTYIWICCLCVNQHRVVEKSKSGVLVPTHEFFDIFGHRVKKIGHVLAMMAPWKAPIYITRVWCIFEIFTAHTTDGCKVDIVMPPKEKHSLEQDVISSGGGINALYETLGNTKVENAKASVESDRMAILRKVRGDEGFTAYSVLNNQVNDLLRGWMHGVLTQLVETRENTNNEDYVEFCNKIGVILMNNGELDSAMKLLRAALTICETSLGKNHRNTGDTCSNIASVLDNMGDHEGALAKFQQALDIYLSMLESNTNGSAVETHSAVATTHDNIGCVLQKMGNADGALTAHKQAIAIKEAVLAENHPALAATYNNIGSVLSQKGDYKRALEWYLRSLAVLESVHGMNHPVVATSYDNIGVLVGKKGDLESSLLNHKAALAIRESVLGKDHPDTAASHFNIGSALYAKGDYEGALLNHKACLAVRLSKLGKNYPEVATSYISIGGVLNAMGDYDVGPIPAEGSCLLAPLPRDPR